MLHLFSHGLIRFLRSIHSAASEKEIDNGAMTWAYLRVHGHGAEFGVDVSTRRPRCVTSERLRRRHFVPPTELQRTAAVELFRLGQVRLGRYHHARDLAVHEVLL